MEWWCVRCMLSLILSFFRIQFIGIIKFNRQFWSFGQSLFRFTDLNSNCESFQLKELWNKISDLVLVKMNVIIICYCFSRRFVDIEWNVYGKIEPNKKLLKKTITWNGLLLLNEIFCDLLSYGEILVVWKMKA